MKSQKFQVKNCVTEERTNQRSMVKHPKVSLIKNHNVLSHPVVESRNRIELILELLSSDITRVRVLARQGPIQMLI